jgi:hypothetical protein
MANRIAGSRIRLAHAREGVGWKFVEKMTIVRRQLAHVPEAPLIGDLADPPVPGRRLQELAMDAIESLCLQVVPWRHSIVFEKSAPERTLARADVATQIGHSQPVCRRRLDPITCLPENTISQSRRKPLPRLLLDRQPEQSAWQIDTKQLAKSNTTTCSRIAEGRTSSRPKYSRQASQRSRIVLRQVAFGRCRVELPQQPGFRRSILDPVQPGSEHVPTPVRTDGRDQTG